MFSTTDTIAAIATAAGRGGIGIVRISGPDAQAVGGAVLDRPSPLAPRHATFARLRLGDGRASVGDHVVATFFPAPHSFTTEDTVEISAHGSPVVLAAIVDACVRHGARLAAPGEFTFRAYVHGRIELTQAEAVADLVEAVTPLQARTAFDQLEGSLATAICGLSETLLDLTARLEASLDFPDEGYHFIDPDEIRMAVGRLRAEVRDLLARAGEGRVIREGCAHRDRGAGQRGKIEPVQPAGWTRSRDRIGDAWHDTGSAGRGTGFRRGARDPRRHRRPSRDRQRGGGRGGATRRTGDGGRGRQPARAGRLGAVAPRTSRSAGRTAHRPRLVVANKADLSQAWTVSNAGVEDVCRISARTGEGLDQLRRAIGAALGRGDAEAELPRVTNVRHAALLAQVGAALDTVLNDLSDLSYAPPEEVIVQGLTSVRALLEEISGARTPEDVLEHIFERFCIGK